MPSMSIIKVFLASTKDKPEKITQTNFNLSQIGKSLSLEDQYNGGGIVCALTFQSYNDIIFYYWMIIIVIVNTILFSHSCLHAPCQPSQDDFFLLLSPNS